MSAKVGIILINNTSYVISDGISFIGRDPVICSVILTDTTISKQHALIINIKNDYFISDLQSTNGTKLGDELLIPRKCYELYNNAVITLGDLCCKFILEDAASPFKVPQQLAPRSTQSFALSRSNRFSSIIQTNIHDLPTQLEEYEEATQKLCPTFVGTSKLNIKIADTQILESSINDSPDLVSESIKEGVIRGKRSLTNKNERNTFKTDNNDSKDKENDFIVAETQTENTTARSSKIYEVDESACTDFEDMDISDSQIANIHLDTQLTKITSDDNQEVEMDVSTTVRSVTSNDNQELFCLNETQFDLGIDFTGFSEKSKNNSTAYHTETSDRQSNKCSNDNHSQKIKENNETDNIILTENNPQLTKDEPTSSSTKIITHQENTDSNLKDAHSYDNINDLNKANLKKKIALKSNIHELETQLVHLEDETNLTQQCNNEIDSDETQFEEGDIKFEKIYDLETQFDLSENETEHSNSNNNSGKSSSCQKDILECDKVKGIKKSATETVKDNRRSTSAQENCLNKNNMGGNKQDYNPNERHTQNVESYDPCITIFDKSMENASKHTMKSDETKSKKSTKKFNKQEVTDETLNDEYSNKTVKMKASDSLVPIAKTADENKKLIKTDISDNPTEEISKFEHSSKVNNSLDNLIQKPGTSKKINELKEIDIFNIPTQNIRSQEYISYCKNSNISSKIGEIDIFNAQTQKIYNSDNTLNMEDVDKSIQESFKINEEKEKPNEVCENSTQKIALLTINKDVEKLNETDIFNVPTQNICKPESSSVALLNLSEESEQLNETNIFNLPTQMMSNNDSNNILNNNNFAKLTLQRNISTTERNTYKQTTCSAKELNEDDIFDIPTQKICRLDNTSNKIHVVASTSSGQKTTSPKIVNEIEKSDEIDIFDVKAQNICTLKDNSIKLSKNDNPCKEDPFDIPTQKILKQKDNTEDNRKKIDNFNDTDIFNFPTQKIHGEEDNVSTSRKVETLYDTDIFDMPTQKIYKESDNVSTTRNVEYISNADIFDISTQKIQKQKKIPTQKIDKQKNNLDAEKKVESTEDTNILEIPTQKIHKREDNLGGSKTTEIVNDTDIFDVPTQKIYKQKDNDFNKKVQNTNDTEIFDIPTQKIHKQKDIVSSNREVEITDDADIFDMPTQMIQKQRDNTDTSRKVEIVSNTDILDIPTQKIRKEKNNVSTSKKVEITDDADIFDMPTQVIQKQKDNIDTSRKVEIASDTDILDIPTQKVCKEKNNVGTSKEVKITDDADIFDMPTQMIQKQRDNTDTSRKVEIVSNTDILDIPTQKIRKEKNNVSTSKKVEITDDADIFDMPTQVIQKQKDNIDTSRKVEIASDTDILDIPTQKVCKEKNNVGTSKEVKITDDADIFDMPTQMIQKQRDNTDTSRKVEIVSNTDILDIPTQKIRKEKNNVSTSKKVEITDDADIFDMPTQVIQKQKDNVDTSRKVEIASDTDILDIPTQKVHKEKNNVSSSKKVEITDDADIFDVPTQIICKGKNTVARTQINDKSNEIQLLDKIEMLKPINENNNKVDSTSKEEINDSVNNAGKTINEKHIKNEIDKCQASTSSSRAYIKKNTVNPETKLHEKVVDTSSDNVGVSSVNTTKDHLSHSSNIREVTKNKEKLFVDNSIKTEDNNSGNTEIKRTRRNVKRSSAVEEFISKEKTKKRGKKLETSIEISESPSKKIKSNSDSSKNSSTSDFNNQLNKHNETANLKRNLKVQEKQSNSRKELFPEIENTDKNIQNTTQVTRINNIEISEVSAQKQILNKNNCESVINKTIDTSKRKHSAKSETNLNSDKNKKTKIDESSTSDISIRKSSRKTQKTSIIGVAPSDDITVRNKNEEHTEVLQTFNIDNNEASTSKIVNQNEDMSLQRKSIRSKKGIHSTTSKTTIAEIVTENEEVSRQKKMVRNKSKNEIDTNITNKTEESKIENPNKDVPLRRNTRNQNKKESVSSAEVTKESKIGNDDLQIQKRGTIRNKSKNEINNEGTSSTNNVTIEANSVTLTSKRNQKKKYKVIFTLFRDEEQENIVKKLGGKIVDKIKDADVLVTNQIRRSVKLLSAVSHAIPIVSPRWLDVCGHSNQFVDPWDYLLIDLEAEKKFAFKLKDSLNRAKNGLLLDNYTVMVTKSIPLDMKDILENSGAKYITSCPKNGFPENSFIVSTIEDKNQWPKREKNVYIVSAEAVYSSVIRQKLDLKSHLLV